jgi:hypothetical protein
MTPSSPPLSSGAGGAAAATGRFYFRKKTLSYSIVTNEAFGFPKLLTFLDSERNIIEEFPLQMTPFQVKKMLYFSSSQKYRCYNTREQGIDKSSSHDTTQHFPICGCANGSRTHSAF